jgi:putative membrane protein
MMDGGMMGAMGIGAVLVILTLLAVLVAAVLASIWLARNLRQHRSEPVSSEAESADQALRRRYAAGEIDDDEYQRRRSTLSER